MIEDDIRTYLLTQSPITALVGTDATGSPARIFPMDRQQDATGSAIVYERIGSNHLHNLEKAGGTCEATIQFDCVASTFASAKALGEALRGELQSYRGTAGSSTIHSCILDEESDDYEPPLDGSAKGVWHVIQVYRVQFLESIPTFS